MISIKNKHEIELMAQAGKRLASLFDWLPSIIQTGMSTFDLDAQIEVKMRSLSLKGECKGYGGYPAVSCISVNAVVVHGIPGKDIVLRNGDFVKVDIVGSLEGYCADMARGFFVGEPNEKARLLDKAAKEAFLAGFKLVAPGVRLSSVSHAIEQSILAHGFAVVREFAGHGIGKKMHEDPEIPNFGPPNMGPVLREGMVLAIEPMLTELPCKVVIAKDGWTATTANGCLAAHFENTIAVTSTCARILTE